MSGLQDNVETHVLEVDVLVDVVADLGADEADVAAEVVGREAKLDKLLLLHEDVVRDVVDDLSAEDAALWRVMWVSKGWEPRLSAEEEPARSREVSVGLLRVDVRELAVQNEVGAKRAQRSSDAAAEKRVGEDGSILRER